MCFPLSAEIPVPVVGNEVLPLLLQNFLTVVAGAEGEENMGKVVKGARSRLEGIPAGTQ